MNDGPPKHYSESRKPDTNGKGSMIHLYEALEEAKLQLRKSENG